MTQHLAAGHVDQYHRGLAISKTRSTRQPLRLPRASLDVQLDEGAVLRDGEPFAIVAHQRQRRDGQPGSSEGFQE